MTRLIAWCLAASMAGLAAAQTAPLADPTRPPGAGAESAAESAAPEATTRTRLQSVLISPTRRIAVIDGRTVALGGRIGTATLESVTESDAVLRYADRRETLRLMPAVDKRQRRVADAARSAPAAIGKGNPR